MAGYARRKLPLRLYDALRSGYVLDNAWGVGQKGFSGTESSIAAGSNINSENGLEGYSLSVGVGVPAFGGTAKAHIGYVDAEDTKSKDVLDASRWNVMVGYDYAFTKRTSVYTAVSYLRDSLESTKDNVKTDRDPSAVEVMAGLIHKF